MDNSKIDVVITWVDGSDPKWIREKIENMPEKEQYKAGTSADRFRNWDNLQYIFRGIEKFMPWVNKVHLVTWGHLPKWININCPKLNIVKHTDFIPEQYLPTFNTNTIELNFHRISGLTEQFIDFNDDMFVIGPTKPEDFFVNGYPKDTAILTPFTINPNGIAALEMNNLEIINTYFSRDDVKKNIKKWFNVRYGLKNLRTLIFMQWKNINGIYEPHIPLGFLKSTYNELWDKEFEVLEKTSMHKFRTKNDVTDWLIRHWQLMEGKFVPRNVKFTRYLCLPQDIEETLAILKHPGKCKLICINDSDLVNEFELMKNKVNLALNQFLPEKSSFEL
jgi:hypothetical protein